MIDITNKVKDLFNNVSRQLNLVDNPMLIAAYVKNGFTILSPEPDEIFIDIDSQDQLEKHLKCVSVYRENCELLTQRSATESITKGHFHYIYALTRAIDNSERVAIQALLGSDPVKELLSRVRIAKNILYPILLFEKGENCTNEKIYNSVYNSGNGGGEGK